MSLDYDDVRKMDKLIVGFLAQVDKNTIEALSIGMWGDQYASGADEVMAALIAMTPATAVHRA